MSLFEQNKPTIRKKDNVINIGSDSQNVEVQGELNVKGPVKITSPANIPNFLSDERMKIFSYDGNGVCWTPYFPQSIINYSGASGHDFVYVQTSRGFKDGNDWVLNPGASNMESGKVTFRLESRLFISGSGSNSGLFFDHKKGERLINLTYAL